MRRLLAVLLLAPAAYLKLTAKLAALAFEPLPKRDPVDARFADVNGIFGEDADEMVAEQAEHDRLLTDWQHLWTDVETVDDLIDVWHWHDADGAL